MAPAYSSMYSAVERFVFPSGVVRRTSLLHFPSRHRSMTSNSSCRPSTSLVTIVRMTLSDPEVDASTTRLTSAAVPVCVSAGGVATFDLSTPGAMSPPTPMERTNASTDAGASTAAAPVSSTLASSLALAAAPNSLPASSSWCRRFFTLCFVPLLDGAPTTLSSSTLGPEPRVPAASAVAGRGCDQARGSRCVAVINSRAARAASSPVILATSAAAGRGCGPPSMPRHIASIRSRAASSFVVPG
mmetsp:Transcript_65649/g.189273  ORF Transcript_65649/g.189273 Transcript_65649/m.189273 type:complete len:244 (+) Transcript_65649:31-762(+)